MHPNIAEHFYQKLDPPANLEDAHVRMTCHRHAAEDCSLQVEMNTVERNMLCEEGAVLPYNADQVDELDQRKLRLLTAKRFHQNASHAYWYFLMKEDSCLNMN
jgi:hypothetical protein